MGKSKKKYDSSSSSSSSDASDSSDTSSSEDLEVQRRSKKKKSSGSSRKHKKSTTKSHANSGSDLDSASEQSSNEGAKVAASSAKKKHKKHKKQKKAKKHKKHKSRGESEDEKRVTIHDDEEDDIEEIIEEVVPDRRHRTISSEAYGKDRDAYGSRVMSGVKRGAVRDDRSSVERDRNRGRDRSATGNTQKHPSSKWDSPADGGEYRRKRSHSPRESSSNFRSGQRGNFDEYRKAPKSPPPARDSPSREYERGGRPPYHHRGGRGGGRFDERPSPHQEGRRWGGDRYEDDRHGGGGGRVDDFRKPPNMRRFDNEDRRFDGNRRGSHQHQHSQQRERYDEFSGRDRNPRGPRNNRDDYEDRGGGGRGRRNSSPMGAPPPRGGRDRSPMQQHEFRNDFGGGNRGGYRDRYDGPPQHMERGRFNRRGAFNRGGRGRRGYHHGGSDRDSFHGGSDREMDHRKPSGWGRRSPPPSPRGSPSRSRSRERAGSDRNGGRNSRSGGGRDRISSPPPIKIERRGSPRSTSGSPDGRGASGALPQRQRKFARKEEKDDEAEFEWGAKRKQPKREQDFRGSSEESGPSDKAKEDKEKPNFGLSGKLTEEANKVNGVVIKYAEPAESRKPKRRWRLYPFKGEQALPTLYIHRQSCYLIGRDRKVCDLPIDHPSCSKQHAALQYRLVPYEREDGTTGKRVRPYIIDLESANGTFVNNKKIETKKYVELLEKDVLKFGFSSREYVLLHENSKEDEEDDDVVDDKGGSGGGAAAGASNGGAVVRNKREQSE